MLIRETLSRSLDQRIEEVIKVDQQDERIVWSEIDEYVPTPEIVRSYGDLLDAMITGKSNPSEGIGVWVSGFFGSGKSSFAKNLGYMLRNDMLRGQPAGQLLADKLNNERVRNLIGVANESLPTTVMMVDIMLDRSIKSMGIQTIAEIAYTVLLRELGYPDHFGLAELEISLEAEGKLDTFLQRYAERYRGETPGAEALSLEAFWRTGTASTNTRMIRASNVLHDIDPNTYSREDSYLQVARDTEPGLSIRTIVERFFDLMARRRPRNGLVLIMDEVGQYVGQSSEKIESLRSFVEHVGQIGRNRVNNGTAAAPFWIVVTSQEKLDEVVSNLDSKRVELAKLQDRFRYRVDLAPTDIKTVATTRVLGKTPEGAAAIGNRFAANEGQLNTHTNLERTSRFEEIRQADFVQYYPYLPHYIELSIDIVSGLRLQRDAPRQFGGSNRTIIKQAYEMLVNERTGMADKPVGDLVTLDKVYDLVEGNLSTEKRKDIADIGARLSANGWPVRVAKSIALLELVRDLPRSDRNISALLYDRLGDAPPLPQVRDAIKLLEDAQFVRLTDEGYKLQTQQEKTWETERNAIDPTGKERADLLRETARKIAEARIKPYQSAGRTFKVDVSVDGVTITSAGQIPLYLKFAADAGEAKELEDDTTVETRHQNHQNELHWIATLTPEIEEVRTNIIRSRRMVAKYDQIRSSAGLPPQEAALLTEERDKAGLAESRLQDLVAQSIASGITIFRGFKEDAHTLGDRLESALKALLDKNISALYPKLALGAKPVKGTEAEEILKAANLNALPQLLYEGPEGLGLVVRDSANRLVISDQAEGAREVMSYLQRQHSYGEKVTGKLLEQHFTSIPYGWDADIVRVVLAALLRGNVIEVTHQGRRYRNHLDPLVRDPFSKPQSFRSASFSPRKKVDLKDMIQAVDNLEKLTGTEVDVEEEAIANAIKSLAQQEHAALLPIEATLSANALPKPDVLADYRDILNEILAAAPDDCVRILAGEGKTIFDQRKEVREVRHATDTPNLAGILAARAAQSEIWPLLQSAGLVDDPAVAEAADLLASKLQAGELYAESDRATLKGSTKTLSDAYNEVYRRLHEVRQARYAEKLYELDGRPEWELLAAPNDAPDEVIQDRNAIRGQIRLELVWRACEDGVPAGPHRQCATCDATISQLRADLGLADVLFARALAQLGQAVMPPPEPDQRDERIRAADFTGGPIMTDDDLDRFVDRLKRHVADLLASGARVVIE